jgi:hypothetical protein
MTSINKRSLRLVDELCRLTNKLEFGGRALRKVKRV